VLIEQPTVRVGDVPVLWLPYLWLRSPSRFGLLPPEVAWHGRDGLLAGTGVHLPFTTENNEVSTALDLRAAGYLKGGARVSTTLMTKESSTTLLWDHLDSSLVALETMASYTGDIPATLALRGDALRGRRGRAGTLLLEPAARRYDRAAANAAHAAAGGVWGLGVTLDAPRGGPFTHMGAVGPVLHLGFGAPLATVGAADSSVTARTLHEADEGASSIVSHRSQLRADGRPGPFALGLMLFERADAAVSETETRYSILAGGRARVGLPLVRAFGAERQLLHWLEPYSEASVAHVAKDDRLLGADASPRLVDDLRRSDNLLAASAGVYTSLGDYAAREGVSLNVRGAYAGRPDAPEPLASARLLADSDYVGASSEAAVSLEGRPERSIVTLSRARLGRQDGLNLGGYLEGRELEEPLLVRFVDAPLDAPRVGWLDRSGWTVGGELQIPWVAWLATAVAVDWDVTENKMLGLRGALAYRHRCGCLAALAWAGHRLGREGVDARLTVDLIP
jgi:hypothetical protein